MKRFAVITILATLAAAPAFAEKYVSDPTTDATLHAVANGWNNTYGSHSPDATGTSPGISETYSSASLTVTLKSSGATYTVDFGDLELNALEPIQTNKCSFKLFVNKMEIGATATITAKTPNNTYSYSCDAVAMGIKNFWVTGNITVNGAAVSFSSVALVIDDADYYYKFPCSSSAYYVPELDESTDGGLPSGYRAKLIQELMMPGSQFNKVCAAKTKLEMMKEIRKLAQQ